MPGSVRDSSYIRAAVGFLAAMLGCALLGGCTAELTAKDGTRVTADAEDILAAVDVAALRAEIAQTALLPAPSGEKTKRADGVTLDYSNAANGYVMLKSDPAEKKRKVRIQLGELTYTYDLPADGEYTAYVLSEGSGTYNVRLLEQVEGTTYAVLFEQRVKAEIAEEARPFLYPNQYVPYTAEDDAVLWSYALCRYMEVSDAEEAAELLYGYVRDNITYDREKADSVQSGYLPNVDETLHTGKGICFDYSALLAAMLRVRGIPTKLITGYVGPKDEYHAWNLAYVDGEWRFYDATLARENLSRDQYTDEQTY